MRISVLIAEMQKTIPKTVEFYVIKCKLNVETFDIQEDFHLIRYYCL